jgi:hypothetical protein
MIDKYEILIKKYTMKTQEDTKGSCNVCSISDDDRGLNITEIKFRNMVICLCDHHKNILIQKLTSDNSDYAKLKGLLQDMAETAHNNNDTNSLNIINQICDNFA